MRHSWVWVLVVIIGIAALLYLTRIVSGDFIKSDRLDIPIEITNIDEEDQSSSSDSEESAGENTELESVFEYEKQMIQGDGFSLLIPINWLVDDEYIIISHDTERLLTIRNEMEDELADPDVNRMSVERIAKGNSSFDEVFSSIKWSEDDAELRVSVMKGNEEYAADPLGIEDIIIESGEELVHDMNISYTFFQCLKPCYAGGSLKTFKKYLFDETDYVYMLSISILTGENTELFLKQAMEIASSFEL
jgi:hypothetical protein